MTDRVRGKWWVEEDEDSWELYYAGTDDPDAIVHGYKIIRALKRDSEWAEYWPDPIDSQYILDALNDIDRLRETLSSVISICTNPEERSSLMLTVVREMAVGALDPEYKKQGYLDPKKGFYPHGKPEILRQEENNT